MAISFGEEFIKDLLIIMGLIGVQVIYAAYTMYLNNVLSLGLNPLFLVVFGSLATSVIFLPFAIALERRKWPTRLRPTLMAQFVLTGFGAVTAYQVLMFLGIRKTFPAIASAMPNLGPGFTFIIASCLRFEKFEIRCKYTRAKILGTIVCLGGAIAMSFLQSPPPSHSPHGHPFVGTMDKDWITGCFYLLAAVLALSCTTVLQAATMTAFPAPLSLCVVSFLIGSVLTALVEIIIEGKLDVGSPSIGITSILVPVLVAGVSTCVTVGFQVWCVNVKGPVMVSIFSPIQTVCSAILSAIMLGQVIGIGSLAGMLLMFIGLYVVLWAKKKEECSSLHADDNGKLAPLLVS